MVFLTSSQALTSAAGTFGGHRQKRRMRWQANQFRVAQQKSDEIIGINGLATTHSSVVCSCHQLPLAPCILCTPDQYRADSVCSIFVFLHGKSKNHCWFHRRSMEETRQQESHHADRWRCRFCREQLLLQGAKAQGPQQPQHSAISGHKPA